MELTKLQSQWLAALRSGKYKQANGALKTDRGFCCLGVAEDACFKTTWKYSSNGYYVDGLGARTYMSTRHREAMGLSDDAQNACISMNDELNLTFLQIADRLEEYFKTGVIPFEQGK